MSQEPVPAIAWAAQEKGTSTVGYSTPSWLGDLGKLLALSGPQFFTWKVGTMMAPTEKIKL